MSNINSDSALEMDAKLECHCEPVPEDARRLCSDVSITSNEGAGAA